MTKKTSKKQQQKKSLKSGKGTSRKKTGAIKIEKDGKGWLSFVFVIVIGLTALFLYYPGDDYELVYCDDNIFVNDYQGYNSDPANISNSFKKTVGTTFYRPVLASSFIIDYQMGGTDPSVYRRTNLLMHITASCLVFLTVLLIGYHRNAAFIAGLIYAVHPILTPAASWISGRNDSLITIFILLAFMALIGFYNRKGGERWVFLLLHAIAFTLSLFTKEIGAMLPFVAAGYILLFRKEKFVNLENIALVIIWLIIGLIWYSMRANAMSHISTPDTIGLDAFIVNFPAIFTMIGKLFLPVKMIALSSFESFSIISGIIFMAAITAAFIFIKNLDRKRAFAGLLWFVIFLFPTLMIRIIYVEDFFDYAEHRAYLPMFGIILILIEILRAFKIDFKKPMFLAVGVGLVLILGVRSFVYKPVFKDRWTFWQHMVDTYPFKSRGYLDLGKAYYVKGELDKAEALYHKGVERNPDNFNLYIDLSAVYIRKKEYQKALEYTQKAISINPGSPLAHYNMGKTLMSMKKFSEAIAPLTKALERNQKHHRWFLDLGICYFRLREYDKAIELYNKALSLDRGFPLTYSNLGSAYASKADYVNAEKSWLTAIKIEPRLYEAYNNLAQLYLIMGRKDEARKVITNLEKNGGKLSDLVKRRLDAAK